VDAARCDAKCTGNINDSCGGYSSRIYYYDVYTTQGKYFKVYCKFILKSFRFLKKPPDKARGGIRGSNDKVASVRSHDLNICPTEWPISGPVIRGENGQ
jgi:hypothetical protein